MKSPPRWVVVLAAVMTFFGFLKISSCRRDARCDSAIEDAQAELASNNDDAALKKLSIAEDVCQGSHSAEREAIGVSIRTRRIGASPTARQGPAPPASAVASPTGSSQEESVALTRTEAGAVLAELRELVTISEKMASLRFTGDLQSITPEQTANQRRCIDLMSNAKPRLERVRAQIGNGKTVRVPDPLGTSLGIAANGLAVCMQCAYDAAEECKEAAQNVKRAGAQLPGQRF